VENIDTLICGDAISEMEKMPDDSVDLVFFSPPYEDCRTYGIDFKLKGQEYVDWLVKVFAECVRVCRGLTACVIQGKTRKFKWSATPALLMADLHRAGFNLRRPAIYQRYGVPGSGGKEWLKCNHEYIVCTTKRGKLPWSNNTACGHPPKYGPGGPCTNRLSNGSRINQWGGSEGKKSYGRKKDGTIDGNKRPSHIFTKKGSPRRPNGNREQQIYVPPTLCNPGDVIDCNAVGGGHMGSRLAHENEAPFPEKLAEFFVKSFCPSNGITLDPFCGSGTTCSVAKREGRHFIGIDIRQSQIELTQRRLEEVEHES
jgi:DNA modification methylase